MLNSIEVAKVLSSVTFVRKKVMDAISQGLLFLNTQEDTIGMTAKVKEMKGLIYHNPLNIWISAFKYACVYIRFNDSVFYDKRL